MLRKIFVLALVLIMVFSVVAYAAGDASKEHNAATKLARGFTNAVGCWLEIPKQMYLTSKEDNLYIGLTYGFIKGLGIGGYRLADGVFETVTCVIPPYDKILVEPEYVFEGWQ